MLWHAKETFSGGTDWKFNIATFYSVVGIFGNIGLGKQGRSSQFFAYCFFDVPDLIRGSNIKWTYVH